MQNRAFDWQQHFISTNLMAIGYNAWAGYLSANRGAIVCSTNNPKIGVTGETFKAHFVARPRLAPFLNAWLATPDTVILQHHFTKAHILEAVEGYNPESEVVFLLESGSQVNFLYLKNLPIAPPKCYERICKEWEEFPPPSILLNSKNLRRR